MAETWRTISYEFEGRLQVSDMGSVRVSPYHSAGVMGRGTSTVRGAMSRQTAGVTRFMGKSQFGFAGAGGGMPGGLPWGRGGSLQYTGTGGLLGRSGIPSWKRMGPKFPAERYMMDSGIGGPRQFGRPLTLAGKPTGSFTGGIMVTDFIAPTLNSAQIAVMTTAAYRRTLAQTLKEAYERNMIVSFQSGPGRWPPLSPGYALWKAKRRMDVKADLVLSGKLRGQVLKSGRYVEVEGGRYKIDVQKQFEDTPYVWFHEFGVGRLPQRSFIREALEETATAMAGVVVAEGAIVDMSLKGASTRAPEQRIGATVVSPGALSFGWMGAFKNPTWWIAPPSKMFLYVGVASDLRSVLTAGIQFERMVVPFMAAWAIGTVGATKKTIRRRTRRAVWRR